MSALVHIARSIWGVRFSAEKPFAMMTAYFDEAYEPQATLICGWVASVSDWEHFEADWKLFLIHYKVPHFHMKAFSQSTGPFKEWRNAQNTRKRFLEDAWDIIRSRVKRGFVCGVWHELYDRVNRAFELAESFPSYYALAGREAMDWANRYSQIAAKDEVECIFEDGGIDKGGLIASAKVAPMVSNPHFEPSRDMKDRRGGFRRGVIQLQAADFLAYELRKFVADRPLLKAGLRNPRIPLQKFAQKRPDLKLMTEARLVATCQRYRINVRRVVPSPYANAKEQTPQ